MLLIAAFDNAGINQHSLSDTLQLVAVLALGPAYLYVMAGHLMAAQSPGGKLSWTGRRWQRGGALCGVFISGVLLIYLIGKTESVAVTVPLWALLGYVMILGVRWLWRDWKNQQRARESELQNLAAEGKTYIPPPLTGVNKVWRWALNGYAIILIAGLVYALIRYLVIRK